MSRYLTAAASLESTVIASADGRAIRTVLAASAARLCSSGTLAALSTDLAAPVALPAGAPPLQAARRLLGDARLAGLAAAGGPLLTARLDAVRARIAAAPTALPRADTAALLADLVPAMAREERTVVAASAVDTLDAAGYTVIHETGAAADGIEARRGDEVMLLAVTDGGEINIDHVGTDGECGDRQTRFEAGMAQRGVALATRAVTVHDDVTGPLVTAAAARREASLARAVAHHTAPRARPAAASSGRSRSTAAQTVVGGSA